MAKLTLKSARSPLFKQIAEGLLVITGVISLITAIVVVVSGPALLSIYANDDMYLWLYTLLVSPLVTAVAIMVYDTVREGRRRDKG